jgi:hypothetical protein
MTCGVHGIYLKFESFNGIDPIVPYRNGPRAHFPFNLPLFGDLCQHIKKQPKVQHYSQKCKFEDQIFLLGIWHIWITFATTWFIFTKQILFPISKSNTLD